MPDRFLTKLNPKNLKPHRLNETIYHETAVDDDFLASIARRGVDEPIVVTADNRIISGHRRRLGAIKAELNEVPVLVRNDLKDELDIEEALIEANRQREKTNEQKAREYQRLKEIESERAKRRSKANLKSGSAKPRGNGDFPSGEPVPHSGAEGRSREKAAASVGWSDKTAEKAAKVVEKIDAAEVAGDSETASELRSELNANGVKPAARKAAKKAGPKALEKALEPAKDPTGRPIPEYLAPRFASLPAMRGTVNKLGSLLSEVEKAFADESGGWGFLDLNDFRKCIQQAQADLKFALPWTECPRCRGDVSPKCDLCNGGGFIPKLVRNRLSPEDKKWLEGE